MSQTAKVLLLYAHPESQDSVANRVLLKPATQLRDRKSTRLNSSHARLSRMPSSA